MRTGASARTMHDLASKRADREGRQLRHLRRARRRAEEKRVAESSSAGAKALGQDDIFTRYTVGGHTSDGPTSIIICLLLCAVCTLLLLRASLVFVVLTPQFNLQTGEAQFSLDSSREGRTRVVKAA